MVGPLGRCGGHATAATTAATTWLLVVLVELPGALLVALGEGKIDPLAAVG